MAFVRKKGKSFYLVHNVRENGRVRQVHLACLGNRPRVNPEIIGQVKQEHPEMEIEWDVVRERAASTFHPPFHEAEGLEDLIYDLRSLSQDMRELRLDALRARFPEMSRTLVQELRQLQTELSQVLHRTE